MTEFDPAKFTDKYKHYFSELQQAYRAAFTHMDEETSYDSELIHAIDQLILADSDPIYEGDGQFQVQLPDDATDRIDHEHLEVALADYVRVLETELAAVFGFADKD